MSGCFGVGGTQALSSANGCHGSGDGFNMTAGGRDGGEDDGDGVGVGDGGVASVRRRRRV